MGARAVVLMSHLGRPNGMPTKKFTLEPVAKRLGELMGKEVKFLHGCTGIIVEDACSNPPHGSIILLENVRFHAEEEGKGVRKDGTKFKPSEGEISAFRSSLSQLGDVYVCDAFGTAHRAHSSMVGMQGKMPCVAGLLVGKELTAFSQVIGESVERPLTAIVGGAKISDKVLVIENLIKQSDAIIICGGMAYTFLKECSGMRIGKSLYDKKGAELAPTLVEQAKAKGCKLVFPCDWLCGQDFCNDQETKLVTQEEGIPDGWEGMDCGPESMKLFREQVSGLNTLIFFSFNIWFAAFRVSYPLTQLLHILFTVVFHNLSTFKTTYRISLQVMASKTVVWNGPAGVFEFDNFSKGTQSLLEAVAELAQSGGKGIIGGGDSATAAAKWDMEDKVTFVSTGGGASLELLEGKILPGIAALDDL